MSFFLNNVPNVSVDIAALLRRVWQVHRLCQHVDTPDLPRKFPQSLRADAD
jgi:hypothetical protein